MNSDMAVASSTPSTTSVEKGRVLAFGPILNSQTKIGTGVGEQLFSHLSSRDLAARRPVVGVLYETS